MHAPCALHLRCIGHWAGRQALQIRRRAHRQEAPGLPHGIELLESSQARKALVGVQQGACAVADEDAVAHVVERPVAQLQQARLLVALCAVLVAPHSIHRPTALHHRAHPHLQHNRPALQGLILELQPVTLYRKPFWWEPLTYVCIRTARTVRPPSITRLSRTGVWKDSNPLIKRQWSLQLLLCLHTAALEDSQVAACLVAEGTAIAFVVQQLDRLVLAARGGLLEHRKRLWIRANPGQEGASPLAKDFLLLVACAQQHTKAFTQTE